MSRKLIECVPNFSEGRDERIINAIAAAVRSVPAVNLLHVDIGHAANRTVFTYVGEPFDMIEATFRAILVASKLIDMSIQKGEHPRIGAADVVPFVPISGVSLEQAVEYAAILSERVASELGIPVYSYEASAKIPERKKLEYCRKGEYEGLADKIVTPEGKPDYGPSSFTDVVKKSGASVIGARNFLLAVNFNLDSQSAELASMIAADVRESGRLVDTGLWNQSSDGLWNKNSGGSPSGIKIKINGKLKGCKAIGWYIKEYAKAQVSMNITDMNMTPLYKAFETVSLYARLRGTQVTGTEIIGMLPLKALTDVAEYYIGKQCIPTELKVRTAVEKLKLNDLPSGFNPDNRIIEFLL